MNPSRNNLVIYLEMILLMRLFFSLQSLMIRPPITKSSVASSLSHNTPYCPNQKLLVSDRRRKFLVCTWSTIPLLFLPQRPVMADTGDVQRLFDEARALESQGNILAAQRIYQKVTQLSPNFVYGWSNLGNTMVALGSLDSADESYTHAIRLCKESMVSQERESSDWFSSSSCKQDLYLFYLNRGSVRLNNNRPKDALDDLNLAVSLRGRPDAIVIQNRARANELNEYYQAADDDYTTAISMTSNEVTPLWLRAALVKLELGNIQGSWDLALRVGNKFSEAPEVRAALATILWVKGDEDSARKKFLEIPDRARKNYSNETYLTTVVHWGPRMRQGLSQVVKAVGDLDRQWST